MGLSLLASYAAAMVVNTVRIVIAMWLAVHPVTVLSLTPADVHRLEGIVVYFGGLLLLYEVVRRFDRGAGVAGYALPLGCYYLITLIVPLANGAWPLGDALLTHMVVVAIVPPMLILLACGMRTCGSLAATNPRVDGDKEVRNATSPVRGSSACGGHAAECRARPGHDGRGHP